MTKLLEELRANPAKALQGVSTRQLAEALQQASDAYYNEGKPFLSDDVFDLAKDHLAKIAPKHPFLKQVGAPVAGNKVALPYWMGSLDKIRDDPKALDKWKKEYAGPVVVSDKLDGNSALIVYDKKGIMTMFSRGDGSIGQDISHLLPFVQGLPTLGEACAVRGELILSKANWEKITHKGANARNVVAGAMHRKVPDPEVASLIDFVAYELLAPKLSSPAVAMQYLTDKGFLCVHHEVVPEGQLTMDKLSSILMSRRRASPYECDGIVVVHNVEHREVKGKNPKYAFAFKSILTHEEAEVVVSEVEWTVSKDGYAKPTIVFPVVVLAGAKIQRATGFNAGFIEKHVIGPGSRIVVIRSGDVIPYVVRVLTPAASGKAALPEYSFTWTDTHIDIMVATETPEQKQKALEHFASTLDIPYVAAGTLKKLVAAGFDTIPKLLRITLDDLLKMDGFKTLSAQKVVASLQKVRKEATCIDLMAASNLFGRGLGKKKLQVILAAYPRILTKSVPTMQEVEGVEGIGSTTAKLFLDGLPKFFALMEEMEVPCRAASPAPQTHQAKNAKQVTGLTIVFTGFRDKELEAAIERAGGKVSTSVSKNTSMVVAANPSETSGKVQKAKELGVLVLSKEDFSRLYHL
jgi:DNA ligase (NAD+)